MRNYRCGSIQRIAKELGGKGLRRKKNEDIMMEINKYICGFKWISHQDHKYKKIL